MGHYGKNAWFGVDIKMSILYYLRRDRPRDPFFDHGVGYTKEAVEQCCSTKYFESFVERNFTVIDDSTVDQDEDYFCQLMEVSIGTFKDAGPVTLVCTKSGIQGLFCQYRYILQTSLQNTTIICGTYWLLEMLPSWLHCFNHSSVERLPVDDIEDYFRMDMGQCTTDPHELWDFLYKMKKYGY